MNVGLPDWLFSLSQICHVNSESNVRFYLLIILNKFFREYELLMYLVGRI